MLSSQGHLRRVMAALRKTETAELLDKAVPELRNWLLPRPEVRSFPTFAGWIWPQSDQATDSPQAANAAELKGVAERHKGRTGTAVKGHLRRFRRWHPARAAVVANMLAQVYVDDLARRRQARTS